MVPRRSKRYPAEKVSDFDFSADVVKLGHSLRRQVDLPGLTLRKSIYTTLRRPTLSLLVFPMHASLQLDRKDIDNFGDFQYLGSYIALTEIKTSTAGKGKHGMRFRNWIVFGSLLHHSNKRCNCLKPKL